VRQPGGGGLGGKDGAGRLEERGGIAQFELGPPQVAEEPVPVRRDSLFVAPRQGRSAPRGRHG
jgi:hypothetical protein